MLGGRQRPCPLDDEEGGQLERMLEPREASPSGGSPLAAAQAQKHYRGLLCKAAVGTCLVTAGFVASSSALAPRPALRPASSGAGPVMALVDIQSFHSCTAEGQDCHVSQCCLDGGEHGLQCFRKNPGWAVCLRNSTCRPGVQPGETHGSWDQYGKFQLDSWSCEKLGRRSKPGCDSFSKEDACDSDRCVWFRTGKCLPKCSQFRDAQACPGSHCVWDGSSCGVDPCSAPGESCASSRCCSGARGAAGMTCFEKNKDWATCMDFCDSNSTHKGWACKRLGERTRLAAPCGWAGGSCAAQRCCSNVGFSCVKRDEKYTGCVQTVQHTTWVDKQVPIPDGWDGTIVGGWNSQRTVAAAAAGTPVAGMSLFCFMAILPNSKEVQLMEVAKKLGQGIFACNASAVFHSQSSQNTRWDTGLTTLQNTAVFVRVWETVRKDGRYLQHDWTIKADADCAFLPDRIRSHLWGLRPPANSAMYIQNTDEDKSLSNGQFLGAIEILSKRALMMYFDNADDCVRTMGTSSGEDGFLKGCLDALGVGAMHDGALLKPDFAASYCLTTSRAAFHPLKDPTVLENCYNASLGRGIDWAHVTSPGSQF